MAVSNEVRQAEEIDALGNIFMGDGEFELIGELPAEGKQASPVSLRIKQAGVSVLVTLPLGYPAEESPTFVVDGIKRPQACQLADRLADIAKERVGDECVFDVLQEVEDLMMQMGIHAGNEASDDVRAAPAVTTAEVDGQKSAWNWALNDSGDTLLRVSVNSGAKIRSTQVTNLSELRRMSHATAICLDVQPTRNTENYEIAHFFASCLKVPENAVELIAGGKKEKAAGERQVKIIGVAPEEIVGRLLGSS